MQDFDRTGGNRDSTLGGHTQHSVCIRTQGEGAVTPKETEPDLPTGVGRVSSRGVRWLWLMAGMGTLAVEALGSTPWHKPSHSPPLAPPKTL